MTDADIYFDSEVSEIIRVARLAAEVAAQAAAKALAKKREEEQKRAAAEARYRLRQRHTVACDCSGRDCDCHGVCLIDVDREKLLSALADLGEAEIESDFAAVLRRGRNLYLMGRKEDAADTMYLAVRDVLGVAV